MTLTYQLTAGASELQPLSPYLWYQSIQLTQSQLPFAVPLAAEFFSV